VMVARAVTEPASGTVDFSDASKIAPYALDSITKIRQYIQGDGNNNLRPNDNATRAEVAVFIDRIINKDASTSAPAVVPTATTAALPDITSGTPILGSPKISEGQAQDWARSMGASQKFIDAADSYWKYGNEMGIRPEVLYAQAAKETNYGKFTGVATADMNNWAGIKTATATGDTKADLQTFPTSDDGVRAQFNHIAAYVGIAPVGTPDPRYSVVMSSSWAGTVQYVEQLGGRWAPDPNYGNSIVSDYLNPIMNFHYVPMDKSKKIVYLSPSGQMTNLYAAGMTTEGEQMNLLAPIVKSDLESLGYTVYVANLNDTFQQRADNAYNDGAFAYVAMHTNAANGATVGTECWYRDEDRNSLSLATCVYNQVAALTPSSPDRGLKNGTNAGLAENRLPIMANCLIEIDFHDVPSVAEWIIDNKPSIANSIAAGIDNYWNQ